MFSITFSLLKLPDAMEKMSRAYPVLLRERLRKLTIKSAWLKAAGGVALIRSLTDLSALHSLEITGGGGQGWTDLILSGLASNCPHLQSLKLSHCSDLTDCGLRALCGINSPVISRHSQGYVEPPQSSEIEMSHPVLSVHSGQHNSEAEGTKLGENKMRPSATTRGLNLFDGSLGNVSNNYLTGERCVSKVLKF